MMTKVTNISVIPDSTQNFVEVYKRRRKQKFGTLEKQLTLGLIVFAALFIIFFVLFISAEYFYNQLLKAKVCTSRECLESAMTLFQSVDFLQDPCEDFYKFACGNFKIEHPIPENYLHNSWFVEKENRLNQLILEILKGPVLPTDLKSVRETKEFYVSCANKTELNSIGLKPLFEILELLQLPRFVPNNSTVENFNLGRTLALAQRYLSQDIIVTLSISKGITNSSEESVKNITFLKLSPGLNGINVFDVWNPNNVFFKVKKSVKFRPKTNGNGHTSKDKQSKQIVKATIKFISAIIEEINNVLEVDQEVDNDHNSSHYTTMAYKIMTFSSELIKDADTIGNETDTSSKTEEMVFSTLQAVLDEESKNSLPSNRIDWKEYISTLFENVNKTYDVDNDPIVVENIDYFKHLSKVLGEAKPETIQRHVWWKIIEQYAKHTTSDMRAIYVRYYQALYGESVTATRSVICTNLIKNTMNIALSHEMSRHNNFSETTKKVHEMLKDIEKAFEILVKSLNWMDSQTKNITLDKAKSITNEIGFASWITDAEKINKYYEGLNLKTSDFLMNLRRVSEWEVEKVLQMIGSENQNSNPSFGWFINPLQVNAYYSREDNAIIIPPGILQSPFYFRGLESLNYGAIGTILGHELTHGFDIEGKNYNKYGKKKENWWPNEITLKYEARAKCFVDQYENYTLYDKNKINGTFTLAENIADNGGIRESFKAYKLYVSRHGEELKLPGFENFTHEQLLFLSYANIWCEASLPKYYALSQDPHSPQRVRVLATLQNMKEFSESYKCSNNSFMNPVNKCIIW